MIIKSVSEKEIKDLCSKLQIEVFKKSTQSYYGSSVTRTTNDYYALAQVVNYFLKDRTKNVAI